MATAIINGILVTGSPLEISEMITIATTTITTSNGTKPIIENPHD